MFKKTRPTFVLTIIAAALGLGVTMATAQADEYAYVEKDTREGFMIGVGAGLGHMTCDECEGVTESGGLHLTLGTMVSPRLAIVGDIWAMAHREDRLTLTHGMATVGPQLWILPRFWIRAGVGAARAGFNYDAAIVDISDETETVLGATAALGVELASSEEFSLDLQLRSGMGFFSDPETRVQNLALAVGANWY